MVSDDMNWRIHIYKVYSKASRILGLLLRHSLAHAPTSTKLLAYKTLCKPLLEYAAELWHPYTTTLSDKL